MRPPIRTSFHKAVFVLLPMFVLITEVAAAQDTRTPTAPFLQYGRVGVGVTSLEEPGDEFSVQPALTPSLTLGFALGGNHALELSVGYLRSEATEEWPENTVEEPGPAPYTVSLRAIPVEAVYRYRFSSLQVGNLKPVAGLGATWAAVKDTWESDTPAESSSTSVFDGTTFLGIEANVIEGVSAVARGQYQRTIDSGERFVQAIGLGEVSAHVGVQISF